MHCSLNLVKSKIQYEYFVLPCVFKLCDPSYFLEIIFFFNFLYTLNSNKIMKLMIITNFKTIILHKMYMSRFLKRILTESIVNTIKELKRVISSIDSMAV